MNVNRIEHGIHTLELYINRLMYTQVQKAIDYLAQEKAIQGKKSDPYNIDRQVKSARYVEEGVRLEFYQSYDQSNGIRLIVNPSSLLAGKYRPVELYHPTERSWEKVAAKLNRIDRELYLEPDDLAITLSRIEYTSNLWLDETADLPSLIRLFGKCKAPRYFLRHPLKDRKDPFVNQRYFCIKTNGCAIKVYDKIYELAKYDRCPKAYQKKNLLRIELSMNRETFLKKLPLVRSDSIFHMLCTAERQGYSLLRTYLKNMFPCSGTHVRYEKAADKVRKEISDPNLQAQLLLLLKKTSDSNGLDAAVKKLKKQYPVSERGLKKLWAAFDGLDVNPITLLAESPAKELPAVQTLLSSEWYQKQP